MGPAWDPGVREEIHQVVVESRGVEGPQQLQAVVGADRNAEAGDVGPHRLHPCRRDDSVGQSGRVHLLGSVGAEGSVGLQPVHVDPVGSDEPGVDGRRQAGATSRLDRSLGCVTEEGRHLADPIEGIHAHDVDGAVGGRLEVVAVDGVTVVPEGETGDQAGGGIDVAL